MRHVFEHLPGDDDIDGVVGERQVSGDVSGHAAPRGSRWWRDDVHPHQLGARAKPRGECVQQDALPAAEVQDMRRLSGRCQVDQCRQPTIQ